MLAPDPLARQIHQLTRAFLDAMQNEEYDVIWNDLITLEGAKVLSTVAFPLMAYANGDLDRLFTIMASSGPPMRTDEALALGFQLDLDGARSGVFAGMASGLEPMGWYGFSASSSYVFCDDDTAVLIGDTPGKPIIMPFVLTPYGGYKVDFEVFMIFSMQIIPSVLYKIGLKALEMGNHNAAVVYFEIAAAMDKPFFRLRKTLLENPITSQFVTAKRKQELTEELNYIVLARDQILRFLSGPATSSDPIDMGSFLATVFCNYKDISRTAVTDDEIKAVEKLGDDDLRRAVASTLADIDPIVIQREAEKPHSPAEIADMELPVVVNGRLHYLCLPFKSGLEIKTKTVPVDIAYQIIRPFMYLSGNAVVVFITAKPCSQHLLNYIKMARATQGWAIEVIQHKELAKLLKANGIL